MEKTPLLFLFIPPFRKFFPLPYFPLLFFFVISPPAHTKTNKTMYLSIKQRSSFLFWNEFNKNPFSFLSLIPPYMLLIIQIKMQNLHRNTGFFLGGFFSLLTSHHTTSYQLSLHSPVPIPWEINQKKLSRVMD